MPIKPTALVLCALFGGAFTAAHADPPAPHASAPKPSAANSDADEHDKTYPAQSSVAVKTAFATVAANSPVVAKSLDAKNLAGAQKLIGQMGAFQGTVSKVYVPRGNGSVILDFAPDYKTALTAVVKPAAYAKFPDLKGLMGKRVLVQGKFVTFHGSPQVELTMPEQVKVIIGK